MFIPPQALKSQFESGTKAQEGIYLQSGHIVIEAGVARKLFGTSLNVNMIYYPEKKSLLLAPFDEPLFTQLHKAKKTMLKEKNAKGDRSIAIQEILLDNQIDTGDRSLSFTIEEALSILNIGI